MLFKTASKLKVAVKVCKIMPELSMAGFVQHNLPVALGQAMLRAACRGGHAIGLLKHTRMHGQVNVGLPDLLQLMAFLTACQADQSVPL